MGRKIMNATEIKQMLEPIPKEEWITEDYTNKIDCCCALGHISRLLSDNPNDYSITNCSNILFGGLTRRFGIVQFGYPTILPRVNDGKDSRYPQNTPKDRVMALLDDMIKTGY